MLEMGMPDYYEPTMNTGKAGTLGEILRYRMPGKIDMLLQMVSLCR